MSEKVKYRECFFINIAIELFTHTPKVFNSTFNGSLWGFIDQLFKTDFLNTTDITGMVVMGTPPDGFIEVRAIVVGAGRAAMAAGCCAWS